MYQLCHRSFILGRFLALETVPVPPEQGEEVPEQGDRRQHAGVVVEHDEAHQDAPPVGRDLARREAEVEERVGEEGVKREPQTGLQRVRVHANGPCISFATDLLSWVDNVGPAAEIVDGGSSRRSGHCHGSGEVRKKKPLFQPLCDLGTFRPTPAKSAPAAFLLWKQYQSLLNREKKCRNRATDGSTPASWQSTTKPTRTRHPLGVIWLDARPKWKSASEKKG
jgi:hypothetical protein